MGLCTPAIVYIIFSITQLLFDLSNNMINTAFMKLIVIMLITGMLQMLCMRGYETIAWLIVFIPFIFMSVVVGIMLYVLGLDPATGKIKLPPNVSQDASGNIIVYDPYYDAKHAPVYYAAPNVVVPHPPSGPPPPAPVPYVAEQPTTSAPTEDLQTTTIHT